jgi:hypothetical protein
MLVNAVLVWNTRDTTRVFDQLADTHPELVADDSAPSRLAPVGHRPLNPLGCYRDKGMKTGGAVPDRARA